jgi:hypothetical protein
MSTASDPGSTGALRTYDAYADAEALGIEVGFEPLPAGVTGVLLREQSVVLIEETLDECARHDELAHQLTHWRHRPRPGEADPRRIEEAVRRETARRLIPLPTLATAIATIIATDNVIEPDPALVANLLGSSLNTLYDRLLSITPTEIGGAPAAVLLGLLKVQPAPGHTHRCIQDTAPNAGWMDRVRGIFSRTD